MKERNSSFELMRILSIFAILGMHSMNRILDIPLNRGDVFAVSLIQSVFNISSSCLMLMAGYFGLRLSAKKVIHIEGMFLFWSLMELGVLFLQGEAPGRKDILGHILPLTSSENWFVTGYVCILVLSGFINKMIKAMSKKEMEKLMLILISIFYILPTLFYFEITGTNGKGVIHQFILYLIGRYLAQYGIPKIAEGKKWLMGLLASIFCMFVLNVIAEKIGMRFWFARDCSVLILFAAVCCVCLAARCSFHSAVINFCAGNILAVILNEEAVTKLLLRNSSIRLLMPDQSFGQWDYYLRLFLWCLLVMGVGILAEKIRFFIMGRLEGKAGEMCEAKIGSFQYGIKG